MNSEASRRRFLATGLSLPVAGMASVSTSRLSPAEPAASLQSGGGFTYRTLGKTGLKVTSVGFGCMITSDQSVVERGADVGITYFDTARGYQGGNNERMVGAALKGKRKNLVLSTKTQARDKATALQHIDTSLKELGTDYVDIWYLHGRAKIEEVSDELIDAQQTAKQAGKIRFTGVSTHAGQVELIPALVKTGKIDVILTSYNFTLDPAIGKALDAARQAGVGIVAMKVMAGGFRRINPTDKNYAVLKRPGAMLASLKWVLNNKNVDTTIPSITDMDQLDENLKAMSQPYSDADQKLLAAQLEHIRPMYCRTCGECEGKCPRGLPVADILRYLMYSEGYGQFALGREHFRELPEDLQLVRCADCSDCTIQCPNGINIASRVALAQEAFA
ncbi:MAG TPA: aldo/keto reductase [Bryobacteraceae bacterium]|nr:aldo/keto reductase [Bryobacteraceae bacterium]